MSPLAGILTTWATVGRPPGGDHEYVMWAIGTGVIHAPTTLLQ